MSSLSASTLQEDETLSIESLGAGNDSEQEVTSPIRRPKRKSAENAAATWQVKTQTEGQIAANSKRTGRPANKTELQPRRKQKASRSTAQAWNLGASASDSSKQEKAKYDTLKHYHQVVKPLADAVQQLNKTDRENIRAELDALEARNKLKKRAHRPADQVSKETVKKRLKRFEEDCGNDVVGHLRAWIEQDRSRLDTVLDVLKGFGDALFQASLSALDELSPVEAVAFKTELGLSESEYNVLRNWVPDLLPPLFQVQQLQNEVRPTVQPILDGFIVEDICSKLLKPELEAYVDRESSLPASQRLPRVAPFPSQQQGATSSEAQQQETLRCEVEFGGDGFSVKDAVTGRLVSHEQAAFLPLLPDRKPNSRNNSRPVAKQTAPVVPGVKGHSGEDREHLQPIFDAFNQVILQSQNLQVRDKFFQLIWLLSSDYKFLAIVFGLGPGAASSKFFCLWCLTALQQRNTTVAHLGCERSRADLIVRGAVWEEVRKGCTRALTPDELIKKEKREQARLAKESGKPVREKVAEEEEAERLDGRQVAQVMSYLLQEKVTFERAKDWSQSVNYPPLVDIEPVQAVVEVLQAGINLVSKHVKTAAAILQKLNVDLYDVLAKLGLERDVMGWEWEKSRVVRKRASEWLQAAFGRAGIVRPTEPPWAPNGERSEAQQYLEALLLNWKWLDEVLDVCEQESPSEETVNWYGVLILAFGSHLRDSVLSQFHSFSTYDHLVICHTYFQLLKWGSLARYGSWYLEASNALWKAIMRDRTSQGGGIGIGASRDKQALQALSVQQNHAITEKFKGVAQAESGRGPGSYVCRKCNEPKVRGHSKVCKARANIAPQDST